jgi:hypothetical protein
LCFVATLITILAIGIMILSIVAIDNFGDDFNESFNLQDKDMGYRNAPKDEVQNETSEEGDQTDGGN